MNKLTPITLKQAEKDDSSSLWVLNSTKPKGTVNINMPDGLGGVIIMVIPITWIPVDLTTQATKDSLLKSPVFRRLVVSGAINIVSEEDALVVMQSDDAKKEALKVYSVINEDASLMLNSEAAKVTQQASGDISGFALNIVDMDVEEDKILSMIRNQEGVLTKSDYEYIASNSKHGRVKEFCAQAAVDQS